MKRFKTPQAKPEKVSRNAQPQQPKKKGKASKKDTTQTTVNSKVTNAKSHDYTVAVAGPSRSTGIIASAGIVGGGDKALDKSKMTNNKSHIRTVAVAGPSKPTGIIASAGIVGGSDKALDKLQCEQRADNNQINAKNVRVKVETTIWSLQFKKTRKSNKKEIVYPTSITNRKSVIKKEDDYTVAIAGPSRSTGISGPAGQRSCNNPIAENAVLLGCLYERFPKSLQKIFPFVSKEWRNVSEKFTRVNKILVLRRNDESSVPEFANFVQAAMEGEREGFRNIHIIKWNFRADKDLDKFWRLAGKHLDKLKITDCNISYPQLILGTILCFCPHLTDLDLENTRVVVGTPGQRAQYGPRVGPDHDHPLRTLTIPLKGTIHFGSLFQHFLRLERVTIPGKTEFVLYEYLGNVLKHIQRSHPYRFPHGLVLNTVFHYELFDIHKARAGKALMDMGIRFTKLIMCSNLRTVRAYEAKKMFEQNADTLESLILDLSGTVWRGFPFGVNLRKLINLKLTYEDKDMKDLRFLAFMPNLERLSLGKGNVIARSTDSAMEGVQPLLALKELIIDPEVEVAPEDIERLRTNWMPNVTVTRITVE